MCCCPTSQPLFSSWVMPCALTLPLLTSSILFPQCAGSFTFQKTRLENIDLLMYYNNSCCFANILLIIYVSPAENLSICAFASDMTLFYYYMNHVLHCVCVCVLYYVCEWWIPTVSPPSCVCVAEPLAEWRRHCILLWYRPFLPVYY